MIKAMLRSSMIQDWRNWRRFCVFGGTFALREASRASAWEVVVAPFSCFVCAGEASTSEEEKVKVGMVHFV